MKICNCLILSFRDVFIITLIEFQRDVGSENVKKNNIILIILKSNIFLLLIFCFCYFFFN